MLLQLKEPHLPLGTKEWENDEAGFNATLFRPLQDDSSLRKKFNVLVKKKIPTGNSTCPPFFWQVKQIFSALVNACNISPHGHILDIKQNKCIMDPMQESNSTHKDEEDVTEFVESTTVISIVDVVNYLLENESVTLANLNLLPRMVVQQCCMVFN